MKKKSLLFVTLTALLLSWQSCKKNADPVSAPSTSEQPKATTMNGSITESPANPNNPYDNFGLQHNQVLVTTRATWDNPNANISDIFDAAAATCTTSTTLLISYKPDIITYVDYIINNSENNFPGILSTYNLSQSARTYANGIYNIMMNPDVYNTFTDYANAIIAIETSVMNSGMGQVEKEKMLKMASTARYSMHFWANKYYADYIDVPGVPVSTMGVWKDVKGWLKQHKAELIAIATDAISYLGSVYKNPPLEHDKAIILAVCVSALAYANAL